MSRRRLTPQRRRQEILDAAIGLLRADGKSVRVEDIVMKAGAAKGTFYTCFADWDDLLDAIRRSLVSDFKKAHSSLFTPPPECDWSIVLPGLSEAFIDFLIGMEGLHDVLFHSEFASRRPLRLEESPPFYIAHILQAGQAAGAYAPMDSQMTAPLIFAVIHQAADAIVDGADRESTLAALNLLLARLTRTPMEG